MATSKLFGEPCKLYIDMGHVSYTIEGAELALECDSLVESSTFLNTAENADHQLYIYDIIQFADMEILCNVTRNPKAKGIAGFAKDTPHVWFVTDEPLEEKLGMIDNGVRLIFVRSISYEPGQWKED